MNNTDPQSVLCVIPVWNEEDKISKVIEEIPSKLVDKVIVIDDGSTDASAEIAERAGAEVIKHIKNKGVGAAIRTGIDFALNHKYDIAIILSGGGKTPSSQIPILLEPIFTEKAELVQGSRYIKGGQFFNMPLSRRLGTRAYTLIFSLFCRKYITDASSGFRAIKLSIFKDKRINLWQNWLNRYELEPYLLYKALSLEHLVLEIPVIIKYPITVKNSTYTKMRVLIDWWKIFRPLLFLALRIKK